MASEIVRQAFEHMKVVGEWHSSNGEGPFPIIPDAVGELLKQVDAWNQSGRTYEPSEVVREFWDQISHNLEASQRAFQDSMARKVKEYPRKAVINYSFQVTDASLQVYLDSDDPFLWMFTNQREAIIDNGTVHYILRNVGIEYGKIIIQTSPNNQTHIVLSLSKAAIDEQDMLFSPAGLLVSAFWSFILWLDEYEKEMQELELSTKKFIELLRPEITILREEIRLEIAFKWYDEKRAKGEKATLQDVADRSGYSLSKVEKASAVRNNKLK